MTDRNKTTVVQMARQDSFSHYFFEAIVDVWGYAGRQHEMKICGNSMFPLIQDGDLVRITHDCTNIKRGDIIVFQQKGKLIIHRVVSFGSGNIDPTFITKGDNSIHLDPPVDAEDVVGLVIAVQRNEWQVYPNTAIWSALSWFIAVMMLMWTKLYNLGEDTTRRFWSDQPSQLVIRFVRIAHIWSSAVLQVIRFIHFW